MPKALDHRPQARPAQLRSRLKARRLHVNRQVVAGAVWHARPSRTKTTMAYAIRRAPAPNAPMADAVDRKAAAVAAARASDARADTEWQSMYCRFVLFRRLRDGRAWPSRSRPGATPKIPQENREEDIRLFCRRCPWGLRVVVSHRSVSARSHTEAGGCNARRGLAPCQAAGRTVAVDTSC